MSIKAAGGVFGRNPTFNDVTVEGDLSVDGTLSVGGNVLSGLDFEGAWDATSGAPSATPSTGQFWIVSVAGTTDLSGITNWGIGDWALYDGSAWQRIEGGADGNFKQLTSSSTTVLNGTTIPASKTLVVTTDIGSTVEAYDATILKSADIGSTVQGYDADTAKYDDTTANFTGTLQNGGSNVIVDSDIGSTVQAYDATILKSADIGTTVQGYDADTAKYDDTTANFTGTLQNGGSDVVVDTDIGSTVQGYDADTAKLDVAQTWTAQQTFNLDIVMANGKGIDFSATSGTGTSELLDDYEEGTWSPVFINVTAPTYTVQSGYYTKIGNIVYVECSVTYSGLDTSDTSTLGIGGLPFSAANSYFSSAQLVPNTNGYIGTSTHNVSFSFVGAQAIAYANGNSPDTFDYNSGNWAASGTIALSGTYRV